jgi:hypothetical protein
MCQHQGWKAVPRLNHYESHARGQLQDQPNSICQKISARLYQGLASCDPYRKSENAPEDKL